jgi:hypothetical protein
MLTVSHDAPQHEPAESNLKFPPNIHHVSSLLNIKSKVKASKAIPVTSRGGLWRCEMWKVPLCLDNRLTDGGKVGSLTHRPLSTPHKHCLVLVLISVRG